MSLALAARAPREARRELVGTWALCIGGLALAKVASLVEPTGLLAANLAGVAAFLFIALPERKIHGRGERWRDFGLPWWGLRDARTWRAWARGARAALAVAAVVFPVFGLAFWAYAMASPSFPGWLQTTLTPYGFAPVPELRLPRRLGVAILVQLFVIALPEELFYRGWMQQTWAATEHGRGRRVLGATVGAGFVATQALFAAGHLVVLQPWRLATFFPGLLFGWLRARTGDLAAPIVLHALSNLFLAALEASFYGG